MRPDRSAGVARYGWLIGIGGVLVVVLVLLNTAGSDGPSSRGLERGAAAPPFAAPLALSALAAAERNDVNVAVRSDQGDAGSVPACSVDRPDVFNVCAAYRRGPVALAFFDTRSGECVEQLDRLDDVAARHPGLTFAAVSIRGELREVRRTLLERHWRFPVAYDHDGILADAYGVVVCPQITWVRRGGTVLDTSVGVRSAPELEAVVRRLEAP